MLILVNAKEDISIRTMSTDSACLIISEFTSKIPTSNEVYNEAS